MTLAIFLLLGGYVLTYAAVKGANPLDVLVSAFTGKPLETSISGAVGAGTPATGVNGKVEGKLTASDFVSRLRSHEGQEYEWGGTRAKTGFDCSGLIYRVMQNAGFGNFPRTSVLQIAHAKGIGVREAINTPGALLYFPGHIAVSLGNGGTIEARGEAYGVVEATAEGRFLAGGLLPEVFYG